ncbi:integrase [Candidatus Magnetoovum chiemensis]|nr:integrase [Candidatus Magnetoovum chiemensis]
MLSNINCPKSKRELENEVLFKKITAIYEASKKTYGSPRIKAKLKDDGVKCNKKRVARIMRDNGIYARTKRKFKATTNSKHEYPVADNLLNQDFKAAAIQKE